MTFSSQYLQKQGPLLILLGPSSGTSPADRRPCSGGPAEVHGNPIPPAKGRHTVAYRPPPRPAEKQRLTAPFSLLGVGPQLERLGARPGGARGGCDRPTSRAVEKEGLACTWSHTPSLPVALSLVREAGPPEPSLGFVLLTGDCWQRAPGGAWRAGSCGHIWKRFGRAPGPPAPQPPAWELQLISARRWLGLQEPAGPRLTALSPGVGEAGRGHGALGSGLKFQKSHHGRTQTATSEAPRAGSSPLQTPVFLHEFPDTCVLRMVIITLRRQTPRPGGGWHTCDCPLVPMHLGHPAAQAGRCGWLRVGVSGISDQEI